MATVAARFPVSAPIPAPGAPMNRSKYKPKRKFYSAGNYISGEMAPDSPDTVSPSAASDAQPAGHKIASLPFDFPPPRLEINSYSTMDVTPPKKRHLSGNKSVSTLAQLGQHSDVNTQLHSSDVTHGSGVTGDVRVGSNGLLNNNGLTSRVDTTQHNDVTNLNGLMSQNNDVTNQHIAQHNPALQTPGDVTQVCDVSSQQMTGSVLPELPEDTTHTTLLQALETPQTTQEICMALLNMAFWRPDNQTAAQENPFTDSTGSMSKHPGEQDQCNHGNTVTDTRACTDSLHAVSQGTDRTPILPEVTAHAQQYRPVDSNQNSALLPSNPSPESLGQSQLPCLLPGTGGFPNSQIQVNINLGFNQGAGNYGNPISMGNTNTPYTASRAPATVTSSHTSQCSSHVAQSQCHQLLVQNEQTSASTSEVYTKRTVTSQNLYGVSEEASPGDGEPQHKRRRTESEASHASDSTESVTSNGSSDVKISANPSNSSVKKTTSLFPKPAKGRTLCEIVDIMSRRHQEDYYIGWTAEKILELPPDERPNVFPVTQQLKKELVSKSVTTENKKLAFSWLSAEPWAQDFRWKLQNGFYKTLSDAKRDASQLWRENCPDYDSSRAVRMRDDAGNIVMKRTRAQSGSEFAYRQNLRKAKVGVIVDQIWAKRSVIREAMQTDKFEQLSREMKVEITDYEPPSDRISQLVDIIAFSLRKELLSTEI